MSTQAIQKVTPTVLELGNYRLELVPIKEFKKYYYENFNQFSAVALNSFLKALDIPPKFFKEQPEETQKILLNNREEFIANRRKYIGKVIVVARTKADNWIINACRMAEEDAKKSYETLKPMDSVENKFEHRSFDKDGYITYVISKDIQIKGDNQVLVIDYPILLNKKTVIHEATYTIPNATFATPVEHIHYLTSTEVDYEMEYKDIKEAINSKIEFLSKTLDKSENKEILRESEVVSLALAQSGIIPNSYVEKVSQYITDNSNGTLTTSRLESLVLDYDETFRNYKQVTNLRKVDGLNILKVLESDTFKEFIEEMEKVE